MVARCNGEHLAPVFSYYYLLKGIGYSWIQFDKTEPRNHHQKNQTVFLFLSYSSHSYLAGEDIKKRGGKNEKLCAVTNTDSYGYDLTVPKTRGCRLTGKSLRNGSPQRVHILNPPTSRRKEKEKEKEPANFGC